MPDDKEFVDYYSILQVNPDCSAKTLETAYRYLAKMYHPDHPETADFNKFNEVVGAYKILRNVDHRNAYDAVYYAKRHDNGYTFPPAVEGEIDITTALDDAEAHAKILLFLYKRRREKALDAGEPGFFIQEMLGCSDEIFEFHRWFLKAKGFIEITEQGTLAITIEGVDHVISMSRTEQTEKLLLTQVSDGAG